MLFLRNKYCLNQIRAGKPLDKKISTRLKIGVLGIKSYNISTTACCLCQKLNAKDYNEEQDGLYQNYKLHGPQDWDDAPRRGPTIRCSKTFNRKENTFEQCYFKN